MKSSLITSVIDELAELEHFPILTFFIAPVRRIINTKLHRKIWLFFCSISCSLPKMSPKSLFVLCLCRLPTCLILPLLPPLSTECLSFAGLIIRQVEHLQCSHFHISSQITIHYASSPVNYVARSRLIKRSARVSKQLCKALNSIEFWAHSSNIHLLLRLSVSTAQYLHNFIRALYSVVSAV